MRRRKAEAGSCRAALKPHRRARRPGCRGLLGKLSDQPGESRARCAPGCLPALQPDHLHCRQRRSCGLPGSPGSSRAVRSSRAKAAEQRRVCCCRRECRRFAGARLRPGSGIDRDRAVARAVWFSETARRAARRSRKPQRKKERLLLAIGLIIACRREAFATSDPAPERGHGPGACVVAIFALDVAGEATAHAFSGAPIRSIMVSKGASQR